MAEASRVRNDLSLNVRSCLELRQLALCRDILRWGGDRRDSSVGR